MKRISSFPCNVNYDFYLNGDTDFTISGLKLINHYTTIDIPIFVNVVNDQGIMRSIEGEWM